MAAKISTVENYHCEVELALSRRDAGKNTVDVAAHLSGSDRVIRSTVTYDVITQLDAFAVPAHHEAVDITGKLVSHVVVDSESDLPKPLRLECELTDVQVQNGVNVTQVWHSQNSCELQIDIGNSSGFHVVHFGLLAPSGKRLHELIPVSWETPERLAVSPKQVVVQAKTDVIRFLVERPEVLRNSEEWIVEFDGKQIWEFGWQPLGDGAGRLEIPMPKSNSVSAHGSHALQITLKQETVTVPVTILKGDK